MLGSIVLLLSSATFALAIPTPTTPGGDDVYAAGQQCSIAWDADTTGKWKAMNIQFMSGPNSPMVHMRTIATNIDSTTTTSFTWTCPELVPYSKIYFYQFSDPSDPENVTWATRFTITGADGSSIPPQLTSSDGIQYGTGSFVDKSLYNAPPAYLADNGQIDGGKLAGNSTGTTTSASASAPPTSPAVLAPSTTTRRPSGTSSSTPSPTNTGAASQLASVSSYWYTLAAVFGAAVAAF